MTWCVRAFARVCAYMRARECVRAHMCSCKRMSTFVLICVCLLPCTCVCMRSFVHLCLSAACACVWGQVWAFRRGCLCLNACACVCAHVRSFASVRASVADAHMCVHVWAQQCACVCALFRGCATIHSYWRLGKNIKISITNNSLTAK